MRYPKTTWAALTNKQIDEAAKLTSAENEAVSALLSAARRLPRGITFEVDEDGLIVRKQITRGYHHNVRRLRRKSLNTDNL